MAQPPATTTTSPDAPPDPTSTQLNLACLDFLLIELVPMAYRIAADLTAKEEEWIQGSKTQARSSEDAGSTVGVKGGGGTVGRGGGGGGEGEGTVVDEEESREAVFQRLETLGYRVGLGIVERFSRDKPRPQSPLDIIKFLCKDLWTLLFRKQIDNLKTNHRGIYVLTDNTFKPLSRMSFDTKKYPSNTHAASTSAHTGGTSASANPTGASAAESSGIGGGPGGSVIGADSTGLAKAQPFLYFPAGIIRGCLAALGIQATVNAETSGLPVATFQIRTVGAKA